MSEYKDIETVKHSFVTRDNDETKFTAIRIDEVKFKDVIYAYNDVQMGTENPDGSMELHFNILEIKSENDNHHEFEEEFHKVTGDILISCLEKGLRKEDEVDIIYRNHDSQSLAQQRELQSEGITISED